jgi:hypothetical protein
MLFRVILRLVILLLVTLLNRTPNNPLLRNHRLAMLPQQARLLVMSQVAKPPLLPLFLLSMLACNNTWSKFWEHGKKRHPTSNAFAAISPVGNMTQPTDQPTPTTLGRAVFCDI